MGFRKTKLFCPRCNAMTTHLRPSSHLQHELHGLLSLLTCGLWLPVYGVQAWRHRKKSREPYRCGRCQT